MSSKVTGTAVFAGPVTDYLLAEGGRSQGLM